MKTSNRILWGSFAGLLAVPLIFLVALRVSLGTPAEADSPAPVSGARGSRQIAMVDFTGLELQGHWEVEVSFGETENVVVEGAEDLLAGLSVRRRGNALSLEMSEPHRDTRKLRASIVCPALDSLWTKGVVDLRFVGFDTDHLLIRTEGVAVLNARGNRIRDLGLRAEGVSKIDLRDNPVGNAELDCEGVVKLQLTMAGGDLTGHVQGSRESDLRRRGEPGVGPHRRALQGGPPDSNVEADVIIAERRLKRIAEPVPVCRICSRESGNYAAYWPERGRRALPPRMLRGG